MHTTNLRKVGGSVMLAVPPAILDQLHLKAGATVGLAVDGDRLILQPQTKSRYTLDELLARCDYSSPLERTEEELEWLNLKPVGHELSSVVKFTSSRSTQVLATSKRARARFSWFRQTDSTN